MTSAFSWQNSISLCPASFHIPRPNLTVDSLSPSLLFGLVGIYHVPLPVEYFSVFSFCLDCCVWGCFSVCWKFVVPLAWRFLPVGGLDKGLVKVSLLGKLA